MHYYQFNIGDYKSHTDYLSPMEDLAYRRMLDWCYLHEKELPSSPQEIARKIGLRDFVKEIELVLCDFFTKTEGGYSNHRIMEEVEAYKAKAESARVNGKKGGRPRKETQDKPKKTQSVLLANQRETGSKAKQEPITNNQETNKDIVEQARLCLDYLNLKAKRNYKHTTSSHVQNINARLKEGFTVDDIKRVIDTMCGKWLNDSKMVQYLRPSTLFGADKFQGYLAASQVTSTDYRNPTQTQDYTQGW